MIEKASALIMNKDNKLLVVKKKSNKTHYILPGGKLYANESADDALLREIGEELSVKVKEFNLVETFVEKSQFEDFSLRMYLFDTKISGTPVASSEIEEVKWIDIFSIDSRNDLATGITAHAVPYLKKRLSKK